ncbi:MAG: helix-turn-helix transcriptional regulator [Clostridia bacterium]|nr:helix-turn-helix transcriptional regulator [Clostridia bacterium]
MEKTYLQQVGERLQQCRTRNFFSRKELAERAGVPISSIKKMERGQEAVGIDDAIKICKELDSSAEYILTGACGLTELIRLNQKILNLPDIRSENLQKIAQAFWSTCPRLFR